MESKSPEVFTLTGVEHAFFESGKCQGTASGLNLASAQLRQVADGYKAEAAKTSNPMKKAKFGFVVSVIEPLVEHLSSAAQTHKAKGDEHFQSALAGKQQTPKASKKVKKGGRMVRVARAVLDTLSSE